MADQPEKVFVLVTRLKKKGCCDRDDDETYAGYLTDEEGNYILSPRIGKPLIVGGDGKSRELFSFSTEDIISVFIKQKSWIVLTSNSAYEVRSRRLYH